MFSRVVHAPVALWGLLMALTCLSVGLVEGGGLGSAGVLLIVVIAAFKAQLVIMYYMESRNFPKAWRRVYESWVYAAGAILLVGHYMNLL